MLCFGPYAISSVSFQFRLHDSLLLYDGPHGYTCMEICSPVESEMTKYLGFHESHISLLVTIYNHLKHLEYCILHILGYLLITIIYLFTLTPLNVLKTVDISLNRDQFITVPVFVE